MAKDCVKKSTGNCTAASEGGHPVQCVGEWANEKHDYIRRYVAAASGARQKFATRGDGGLCYVDLFAGPGRAYIAKTGDFIDGTPLIAMKETKAPFTRLIFCDKLKENAAALRARTGADARVHVVEGDCNERIEEIAALIPRDALSLAVIDPFGAKVMGFETIARLAKFPRMDLIVHFPTMGIKRNIEMPTYPTHIDRLLGSDAWQTTVGRDPENVVKLIPLLKDRLATLGYVRDDDLGGVPAFKNDEGGVMYHLFFAAKHDLGHKLWRSITQTTGTGQKSFGVKGF